MSKIYVATNDNEACRVVAALCMMMPVGTQVEQPGARRGISKGLIIVFELPMALDKPLSDRLNALPFVDYVQVG